VFMDGAAVCWKDDVWHRGGTDDLREPPQVGWAPMGPSGVTEIVSEQKGGEAPLGGLASADGLCTGPRAITNGVIFPLRDLPDGEVPRARQAGQLPGISAVGFDAIAGFLGDQRGCDPPARRAFFHQIPIEPVATGTGFIDKEQMCRLGLPLADQLIHVTRAGAKAAETSALGARIWRHIGDRDRVLVDIHAEKECARLRHGGPPQVESNGFT
jgi:hypothetical protein